MTFSLNQGHKNTHLLITNFEVKQSAFLRNRKAVAPFGAPGPLSPWTLDPKWSHNCYSPHTHPLSHPRGP